ncbi:hypothetical protein A605_05835 [Corynebacterium halotolerans YIM 70093 = DSM 44683]|uniref:Uncharacterized protein n=1 Tax=Corynebacterium halotolerans YIM 70093 = DSM 44683 TaxID=1121362 RepID=M1NL93_9CORY|nr:hypothetical protein A605_05835 [Corynebacterium halotolerans YIM 70093 = DSM 44683]
MFRRNDVQLSRHDSIITAQSQFTGVFVHLDGKFCTEDWPLDGVSVRQCPVQASQTEDQFILISLLIGFCLNLKHLLVELLEALIVRPLIPTGQPILVLLLKQLSTLLLIFIIGSSLGVQLRTTLGIGAIIRKTFFQPSAGLREINDLRSG